MPPNSDIFAPKKCPNRFMYQKNVPTPIYLADKNIPPSPPHQSSPLCQLFSSFWLTVIPREDVDASIETDLLFDLLLVVERVMWFG